MSRITAHWKKAAAPLALAVTLGAGLSACAQGNTDPAPQDKATNIGAYEGNCRFIFNDGAAASDIAEGTCLQNGDLMSITCTSGKNKGNTSAFLLSSDVGNVEYISEKTANGAMRTYYYIPSAALPANTHIPSPCP